MNLPYCIAPFKCVVLSLIKKDQIVEKVKEIEMMLKNARISCWSDCGGSSIGKRYSRTDELGIPFAITVDFDSLND